MCIIKSSKISSFVKKGKFFHQVDLFYTLCEHIIISFFTKSNLNEASIIKPFKVYFSKDRNDAENTYRILQFQGVIIVMKFQKIEQSLNGIRRIAITK